VIEGPFPGFDPRLRRILATLPVPMRPTDGDRFIQTNDSGGIMITRRGEVWWIPQEREEAPAT
jgi:hypothetical protein